jgi:hypothetical protein
MSTITLLEKESFNITGPAKQVRFANEKAEIQFWGLFAGATVTVEFSPDGGTTWVTIKDVVGQDLAITEPRALPINVVYGQELRATLTDSGEGTEITVKLHELNSN